MFLFSSFFFVVPSLRVKSQLPPPTNFVFFQSTLTLSPVTGRSPDYPIFSVDIGMTDDLKRPSLCCHFNHMLLAVACCVCLKLCFFPSIVIQQALAINSPAHPLASVPIRHPSDKSSAVTSF